MFFDVDAAIFDMDGTLLDTMPYWRYTPLEYLLRHGLPVAPEDLTRMYQTSSRQMVQEICGRLQYDIGSYEAMLAELEAFMHRHYLFDARLKDPDLPAFLDRLRAEGKRLCVATAAPRAYAADGLARVGILDKFEFVTDGREYGFGKEDPAYFRILAERLQTVPERCLVVEDALYAMRTAKTLGCRVLAVEDGTALRQREEIRALADVYIRRYAELKGE